MSERAASLQDAARIETTVRVISNEMLESEQLLLREQRACEEHSVGMRELEERVSELRAKYEEISQENSEYHAFINEKCKEREQCEEVAARLEELAAQIADANSEWTTGQIPSLPESERLKVEARVNEVVDMAFAECCRFDPNEYEQEIERLKAELDELDNEIDILSNIQGEWCPKRPTEILLKEFCKREPKVVADSEESLSTIGIPSSETPNILEHPINIHIPEAPYMYEMRSLERNPALQSDRLIRTYQEQHDFLSRLRRRIEKNESEQGFNPVKFREQLHQKIRLMQEIGSIDPVQIPTDEALADSIDPVEILADQFGKFCDELDKLNSTSGSLAAGLERAAEEALAIPKYEVPPKPRYSKNPSPSPQLTQLSKQLSELSQLTNQYAPQHVAALQSITASHRELLEEAMKPRTQKETINVEVPPSLPQLDDLDMTAVEQFKELAISKLPVLASRLDSAAVEFTEVPVEIPEQSPVPIEETEVDIGVETHIQERSAFINGLLRELYNMEIPAMPNIVPTPMVTNTYEPIDTTPLLDAIDEVLSPTRLSADVLKEEIGHLEAKLAETRQEMAEIGDEEEIDEREIEELRHQIEMITDENKQIESAIRDKITVLRELRTQKEELQSENKRLEEELQKSESISEEVTKMEIKVKEERAKLEERRQDFEEEKRLREELSGS